MQYNGAELLCTIINDFFTKLLAVVEEYGGDVVKVCTCSDFDRHC